MFLLALSKVVFNGLTALSTILQKEDKAPLPRPPHAQSFMDPDGAHSSHKPATKPQNVSPLMYSPTPSPMYRVFRSYRPQYCKCCTSVQ